MQTTPLTIVLPPDVRKLLDEQIAAGGFGDASEYFCSLALHAEREQIAEQDLEGLLLTGLEGPYRTVTADYWVDIRRQVHERINANHSP